MSQTKKRNSLLVTLMDGIVAIFAPVINLLAAAGIFKGILIICTTVGVLSADSDTYLVLCAMADSLFYFLPVMLASTCSKKFGTNRYTALVIAGVLLWPELNAVLESGTTLSLFGLPVRGVIYHSSVLPIILAVAMLRYVERGCNRIIPKMVQSFLTPLVCIATVSAATLIVFGPVSAVVGDGLAQGYEIVFGLSPAIAGLLLGAAIQPMVIVGISWSFLLLGMNNVMLFGQDTVLSLIGPAVMAQAGAALAVLVKSKDRKLKAVCASAVLSALFGVTEPAMYGVNLPRKKPMAAVVIAGGIGGMIAGISGASASAFVFPSLVTLPVFLGQGFGLLVVGYIVAFAAAFLLTLVFRFEADLPETKSEGA